MVARAEPTLRKLRMKIAIENHKNLRIPDMLDIMERIQSEYVGITVDFGNNYVLMEDPVQIAEAFAPYALTSHIKDHQLDEYEDGIRLFDAQLGTGIIDLPKVISTLRNRQPNIRFNLETMTRDALEVPCFNESYWATYGPNEMSARDLAMTVATARRKHPKAPFPKIGPREAGPLSAGDAGKSGRLCDLLIVNQLALPAVADDNRQRWQLILQLLNVGRIPGIGRRRVERDELHHATETRVEVGRQRLASQTQRPASDAPQDP
jgi:hypothetical protein